MSRENPSPSTVSTPGHIGAKELPPWEESDRSRLMTRSAPKIPIAEIKAMPSLWSTTSTTLPGRPVNCGVEGSSPDSASISPSSPSKTGTEPTPERKLSLADSARATSPHLNEHKHMIPAYEKLYEPVPQPVVALPGTMSSRATPARKHMANRETSDERRHKKGSKESKESTPLGHRFTSAVKGLFRRDPINDTQFEHIGERHWSED